MLDDRQWVRIAATALLLVLAGCGPTVREAIQAGHVVNARHSIVGLDVAPLGRGPEAPRVSLGSSVSQFSVVPSAPDSSGAPQAPPVLNRTDVRAPGVRVTDTVGVGSVGDQINAHVVDAIRGLHGGAADAQRPTSASTP
jgi:hypothetical protein